MGIYTTINGQEIKFTGLFAKTVADFGIKPTNGVLVIGKTDVEIAIRLMAVLLSEGVQLTEDGVIKGYLVSGLAQDAQVLALLMGWVISTDEEELFFA